MKNAGLHRRASLYWMFKRLGLWDLESGPNASKYLGVLLSMHLPSRDVNLVLHPCGRMGYPDTAVNGWARCHTAPSASCIHICHLWGSVMIPEKNVFIQLLVSVHCPVFLLLNCFVSIEKGGDILPHFIPNAGDQTFVLYSTRKTSLLCPNFG